MYWSEPFHTTKHSHQDQHIDQWKYSNIKASLCFKMFICIFFFLNLQYFSRDRASQTLSRETCFFLFFVVIHTVSHHHQIISTFHQYPRHRGWSQPCLFWISQKVVHVCVPPPPPRSFMPSPIPTTVSLPPPSPPPSPGHLDIHSQGWGFRPVKELCVFNSLLSFPFFPFVSFGY